jgi:6-phosphogluconolactonase
MDTPAVFAQTNDAERNQVAAFARSVDGTLTPLGLADTGGRGTGQAHLPSQGSLAVAGDGSFLLVANAGSDDISAFAIEETGLRLSDRVASGGSTPVSIAVHDRHVYVVNRSGGIAGFELSDGGELVTLAGSARSLSTPDADPAQIAFTPEGRALVVTERNKDAISIFAVDEAGIAADAVTFPSAGATPYGFDFTPAGDLVVTEAFGGEVGAAAASSYHLGATGIEPVSASVADTRSEVCWAVTSKDGRSVYVTNFGDGTISRYAVAADGSIELAEPIAASTVLGEKGIRDAARSADGRFLYALDADAQQVFGWRIGADGTLDPIGAANGLPETVAGLAAV